MPAIKNTEKPWTRNEEDTLVKLWFTNTPAEIGARLNRSARQIERKATALRGAGVLNKMKPEDMAEVVLRRLQAGPVSPSDIAKMLGIDVDKAFKVVDSIGEHYAVYLNGGLWQLNKPAFGRICLPCYDTDWNRIGLVSDTHLCCREERLEALHATYDIFKKEGIKRVFHAGNIVDGYIPKINGATVIVSTPDDQAQYVVDNYPQRDGISTYFITGDDHEGWWRGLNFGAYLSMIAKDQGRKDLIYLGHVEADVELKTKSGKSSVMKVQHPGGGSSYARSYTAQKQVEAFQGGEKPAILIQGHYHVNNYMMDRNVHVISLPGFQDQTIFARKKRLRMDVGGGILEWKQNPADGAVVRLRYELIPFFDRGYYRAFIRSDSKLVKGHIVLDSNS